MTDLGEVAASFDHALLKACETVSQDSFQFELAGSDDYSLKERAYCYELHHRLKSAWPEGLELALHPEIPKQAHPILADCVGNVTPDFILHRPRRMDENCVVVEVKSAAAISRRGKDWETLRSFLTCGQYYAGRFLVFGKVSHAMKRKLVKEAEDLDSLVGGHVGVIYHETPGEPGQFLYRTR